MRRFWFLFICLCLVILAWPAGRQGDGTRRMAALLAKLADEADALSPQRPDVQRPRIGAPDELKRWLTAGGSKVEHALHRVLEDAHRVEPPQDVAPAIRTRHPQVAAHRERDGAT